MYNYIKQIEIQNSRSFGNEIYQLPSFSLPNATENISCQFSKRYVIKFKTPRVSKDKQSMLILSCFY